VPVRGGQELAFKIGQLIVGNVSLNGREMKFSVKDGRLTFKPLDDGIADIRYEGTFKGGIPRATGTTVSYRAPSMSGHFAHRPGIPA